MEQDEIMRRLRALCAMPKKERPFTLFRLSQIAGVRDDQLQVSSVSRVGMYRDRHRKLERAFTLLENDQVVVHRGCKHYGEKYTYTIREPEPKQSMLTRIRMTERGPVLDFVAVNKAAFPVLPETMK
jgi:hypothetical protein